MVSPPRSIMGAIRRVHSHEGEHGDPQQCGQTRQRQNCLEVVTERATLSPSQCKAELSLPETEIPVPVDRLPQTWSDR